MVMSPSNTQLLHLVFCAQRQCTFHAGRSSPVAHALKRRILPRHCTSSQSDNSGTGETKTSTTSTLGSKLKFTSIVERKQMSSRDFEGKAVLVVNTASLCGCVNQEIQHAVCCTLQEVTFPGRPMAVWLWSMCNIMLSTMMKDSEGLVWASPNCPCNIVWTVLQCVSLSVATDACNFPLELSYCTRTEVKSITSLPRNVDVGLTGVDWYGPKST